MNRFLLALAGFATGAVCLVLPIVICAGGLS
jgi:hypothetical protein